ncbi:MAG: AI-2E family transporter [Chloroflexi bacterium]|nr:AI-2E family transporter [Chloroflexota bacterium]
MTESPIPANSPRWSAITKLTVSLTVIVILGALIIRFRGLLGPVLFAFVVAYLLHPVIAFITRKTPLSWKLAVSLVYLIFVAILITLLTLGGVELVQQVQNLIVTIQENVDNLPVYIEQVSNWKFSLGPFELDFAGYDWELIGNQVLTYVEPALGQIGSVVGSLATSAATTIGWIVFILIVSYFFLFESGGLRDRIIQVNIPVYADDIRRMGEKLSSIWNAFLRGQIIIFFLTSIVYAIFLSALGVRYALVLAIITGFANFIPYVGPAINWVVLGLVTYFQPYNFFGLSPFAYMAIIIIVAILIDQVFNNLINPRIMASALKVHPAFVLIAALLAANLIGVIGVIIAAPILATVQLVGTYIVRKMLDRDPWPPEEELHPPPPFIPAWVKKLFRRRKPASGPDPKPARKKSK